MLKRRNMSKADKILKQWRTTKGSCAVVSRQDIVKVLEDKLADYREANNTTGSHRYKIRHEIFKELSFSASDGMITIPIKAKNVKRIYADRLLKVMDLIEKNKGE